MPLSSALGPAAFAPAGLGFRNLLINGAMQFAQRGTSASGLGTVTAYYTADRWQTNLGSIGTWTQTVENDAPTGSGFRKSLKMLCTTANASLGAGAEGHIWQKFEGQNLQSIKKGTASAEQVTLSFWVKSNVTGTRIVELYDGDNTRQCSKSYTVDASGTWEKKVITFPADTTGEFDNDNALSLYCLFWLAAGSNFTSGTLGTTWSSATSANRAVGQVNTAAATNNYWQITGVQLEIGANATAFDFRPITVEQALCERYYEKSYELGTFPGANDGTGSVSGSQSHAAYTTSWLGFMHNFRVQKRAIPTITVWDLVGNINKTHRWALGVLNSNNQAGFIGNIGTSGVLIYSNGGDNASGLAGHFVADAEL